MTEVSAIAAIPANLTGFGLVSPLGHSGWNTFGALLAGRTLADRLKNDSSASLRNDPVGLVRRLGCTSLSQHAADPAVELAERAARQALGMAGIPEDQWPMLPCYLGVSKGAMIAWERELTDLRRDALATPCADSLESPTRLGPVGYLAAHLRRRLNIGPVQAVMGACASSLIALHLARLSLLRSSLAPDQPRRVLVLTAEAALLPLFIQSYKRLGVLPPLSPGGYAGLPLDQKRRGFMLSELAAAVVLEIPSACAPDSDAALTGPCGSFALQLLDTAMASEGHDLMQPAPDMPALAHIVRRLAARRHIDVLHPHATGTPDNDAREMAVYQRHLRDPGTIRAYACKGALGHGLGAAGLVSLVLACLCARMGRIPPMPWLTQPIDTPFPLQSQGSSLPSATTHAIFAAGFGGHVAGALVKGQTGFMSMKNR